jgi:hypothetical protein
MQGNGGLDQAETLGDTAGSGARYDAGQYSHNLVIKEMILELQRCKYGKFENSFSVYRQSVHEEEEMSILCNQSVIASQIFRRSPLFFRISRLM